MTDHTLRYPIGEYEPPPSIDADQVRAWIDEIADYPHALAHVVRQLDADQLDVRYRPGGWRVRQVVHHVADSHLNSYVRFKWALTEDRPRIKAYHEDRWAELGDYASMPVEASLAFLARLHERWVYTLRALTSTELARAFIHPELGAVRLDTTIGSYAWHGRHHLAHITTLAAREGWPLTDRS